MPRILIVEDSPTMRSLLTSSLEELEGVRAAVAPLDHAPTRGAVTAERAFLAALGGGCNVPLGAYARWGPEGLRLGAFVARADGTVLVRGERTGAEPEAVGRALAEDLLSRGARELLP